MYCCDQSHCPDYRNSQEGKQEYCCVVPKGLCCPEYSDSYCETYNNNPRGPKPDNWADSIRRSCCAGKKSTSGMGNRSNASQNQGCGGSNSSSPKNNNKSCCSCSTNENKSSCGGNSFNYKEIYVGFNESLYAEKSKDKDCC